MSDAKPMYLAQVNIGRVRGEMNDPIMAGFVARLADINGLADQSPGFVWRLQTEDGDATAVPRRRAHSHQPFGVGRSGRFAGVRLPQHSCRGHAAAAGVVRTV